MANEHYTFKMMDDDYEQLEEMDKIKIINKIKENILKTYPTAEFDQEPYFKEGGYVNFGALFIPFFLKENHIYQNNDHIIIDKNFRFSSSLQNKLKRYLKGAQIINFDPATIGHAKTDDESFMVLIHFDMCRNHLKEIIRSILELSEDVEDLFLEIGFTKSDNLKQNKFGGRTLLYLTNANLLNKTVFQVRTYESKLNMDLLEENFEHGITDEKLDELIYEINSELAKQERSNNYWDGNRRDMLNEL